MAATWKFDYEKGGTISGIQVYDLKLNGDEAVALCLVGGTRAETIDGVRHIVWRGSHVRDTWIKTTDGWKRRMQAALLSAVCFIDNEIAGGSGGGVAPEDRDALGGFQFS